MSAGDAPEGVARTALGMALVRAEESRRPDRLFDDPYAAAFVAAAPDAFAEHEAADDAEALAALGEAFAFNATIRTRFYDDYLLSATRVGCRQVGLLAAGLDSRAFRLPWPPGVRTFEVDLPEVFAFKARVLAQHHAEPRCQRVVVAADLSQDWAARLNGANFDATAATAWLIEGLLAYLTPDQADRLLGTVGELSAPDSQLAFEQGSGLSPALLQRAQTIPSMARYTSLFRGGLGGDEVGWLERHGWRATAHDRFALAATYRRTPPSGTGGGYVTAVRRGEARRSGTSKRSAVSRASDCSR